VTGGIPVLLGDMARVWVQRVEPVVVASLDALRAQEHACPHAGQLAVFTGEKQASARPLVHPGQDVRLDVLPTDEVGGEIPRLDDFLRFRALEVERCVARVDCTYPSDQFEWRGKS
jgi:hypothetical protein